MSDIVRDTLAQIAAMEGLPVGDQSEEMSSRLLAARLANTALKSLQKTVVADQPLPASSDTCSRCGEPWDDELPTSGVCWSCTQKEEAEKQQAAEETAKRRSEREMYWRRVEEIAGRCIAAEWLKNGVVVPHDANEAVRIALGLVDEIERQKAKDLRNL